MGVQRSDSASSSFASRRIGVGSRSIGNLEGFRVRIEVVSKDLGQRTQALERMFYGSELRWRAFQRRAWYKC